MKWTVLFFWKGILYDARQIDIQPHRASPAKTKTKPRKVKRRPHKGDPT